ncbi:MAG: hypothetical protein EPN79_11715 [Burkholderiaceae bacterium]|nr:MAG: hypothetical protein EPN79_11715 [Burkholderiaceae bacterium]TBR76676.1 MAG: hypothetical protein EPN64_05350 [Burkholderiaceae bacterium]
MSLRTLAVIGTAGRDKTKIMDRSLWNAMFEDFIDRVRSDDTLVSGGAAWADHLAVQAFLILRCQGIRLYLPAPLVKTEKGWRFQELGPRSSGGAANYYHERFSAALRQDTRAQIAEAAKYGAVINAEPASAGFKAMFARNRKVANACNAILAYTFNSGDEPADGGTLDTWRQVQSTDRVHVDLGALGMRYRRQLAQDEPEDRAAESARAGQLPRLHF